MCQAKVADQQRFPPHIPQSYRIAVIAWPHDFEIHVGGRAKRVVIHKQLIVHLRALKWDHEGKRKPSHVGATSIEFLDGGCGASWNAHDALQTRATTAAGSRWRLFGWFVLASQARSAGFESLTPKCAHLFTAQTRNKQIIRIVVLVRLASVIRNGTCDESLRQYIKQFNNG